MPEISRFYGLVVAMYYNDHAPPHFHARYGKQQVLIDIETFDVLRGRIAKRAQSLVLEWASQHQDELRENWQLARTRGVLNPIQPLE